MPIQPPPRTSPADPPRELTRLADARIMIVDDEELNVDMTQAHLEEAGYHHFITTSDPRTALDLLRQHRPDVLLLDVMMPDITGLEVLWRMAQEDLLKDVPTLMLTATIDSETKMRALQLGATDFLTKPIEPVELVLRLKNTLSAKSYRDRLARIDLLTGLPNRQAMVETVEWAIGHARRQGHVGAVLQVGLDRFRSLNEAMGPRCGDEVLQAVAARLLAAVRTTDFVMRAEDETPSVARAGGDEFIIVLPAMRAADDAGVVAARILGAVSAPLSVCARDVPLTCRVGIALFPQEADDADTLLRNAGAAMQQAKGAADVRYCFYSGELNARAVRKLTMTSELRRAIEEGQLVLHYQPKVAVGSGDVDGAEALVRWQHPERGMVPPGEFIPLAEETGQIVPIGEWVIREACRQLAAWQRQGLRLPRVSVNVSSLQFRQSRFADIVKSAVQSSGAPAERLCIELTESVVMDDAESSVVALQRIKSIGVRISLDDFGTGYSSLAYLGRFPLDELKIDRSYVQQIRDGRQPVASAIIAMARSLGLTVVAEGVEETAQLDFLRAQGCDEYQGFLKSPAVDAQEFATRFCVRS